MTRDRILVVGPAAARPFLDRVAAKVRVAALAEVTIECRYDVASPAEHDDWAETTVLLIFGLPCTEADMAAASKLRAIVVPSIGFEGIDIDAAAKRNIVVANGAVAENFESVAEAAMLFMLALLYRLEDVQVRFRHGQMLQGAPQARMLKGKTIGIIGHGNIARALIQRLHGWQVQILICNRSPIFSPEAGVQQCSLEMLLAESDIVLPLLPLMDDTFGLLTKDRLLAMKKGASLVNLARGAIVDEAALSDPEVVAHMGSIALDVFVTEPLPMESRLRNLDGIFTGHEISRTRENMDALFETAVSNLLAATRNEPLLTALGRK